MDVERLPADRPFSLWHRRRRWALVGVALVAVGVIAFQALSLISGSRAPQRPSIGGGQPVGVAMVRRGEIRLSLHALGTVTPLTTVTVTSQIGGQLLSVGFKEGQRVRKGQFLAQIDPRPYQAALEQYQAQLAHDDALLQQAQMDLERYQKLSEQQSIPRQTYEDQVWTVKQAQGTVANDKAQIKTQLLNLTYCRIVAPADGRVGLQQVDPGNYVQAGSPTGIVMLTLLEPISVIFSVPEDNLPEIMARMRTAATLPATVFDRANLVRLATGKLTAIDTQVDTSTGTVKLRAIFDNLKGELFPSQFVNVVMLLDTLKGAVTVPETAVQRGESGAYVYLVDRNNRAVLRPVRLGPKDDSLFAVEFGLSPGDRVVTDGADRLRNGSRVTLPAGSRRQPVPQSEDPHPQRNGGEGGGQ
jgi:membrane fusion protein, multidrug efflux system